MTTTTGPDDEQVESEESLEDLQERREAPVPLDSDDDSAETYHLPGDEIVEVDLTSRVVPKQSDEFICSECFLVRHRSQLAVDGNRPVCKDCEY